MNRKQFCVLAFAIFLASPVMVFGQERPDSIARLLFQPELIMKFSKQLNLDEQQETILKTELKDAQGTIFDLKWQLNEEKEKLAAILMTTPIDEDQMLAQSDNVMQLEQQIKRVHLTLLARLKNMLSEQQIQTLRELRKERMKRDR